jgi:flavoprotein hydroxylase
VTATLDVAIVGWGPVGETLAILLGQRGHRVAAFEKWPSAYARPRAVHFDDETGRILQSAGVGRELAGMTEPASVYEWRNAAGDTLLRFGRDGAGPSGWPLSNMFSQPALERLLDARARALPSVEVHRGQEVVGVDARDDDVALSLRDGPGATDTVRARWVVGCDGANSFVRGHLGATVTDLGFFFDWLIVDVVPHEPRRWDPVNWQLCDPARPTSLVSGGPGRRRWEFMRLPGETLEELNSEATAWRLLEPWDITPRNATLERHAVYTFQARWADDWRRGRVLIAGDAAHQMPPFAGQGMCAGLRDAANLAWKLDLVLAGAAGDSLLDTYARERIPHVREAIDLSMALGKVICVPDSTEAAARDAALVDAHRRGLPPPPLPRPRLATGVVRAGDAAAGRLFPQGVVACGGRTGPFDDVVGSGWTLLGRACDPASVLAADEAAFFRRLGGRSAHVALDGPARDVNGMYAEWFADAGIDVVLQRPDFYVFGTAATPDGAADLVRALRAALT